MAPPKAKTTIAVSTELKSALANLKKHPDESYETVIQSSLALTQPTTQGGGSAVVGAGSGDEAFNTYSHTLRWIADTKKKLTAGGNYEVTPEMREEAFNIDPLVSGIICPFLKNTLLSSGAVQTADNKKFSACIKDATRFLKEIKLLEVFRDDFPDYAIKQGHAYRRKDYFPENDLLKKLQRLEAKAMITYEDPWDSDIVAYHQRIYVNDVWSTTQSSTMTETNSWFIPEGRKYIEREGIEETGAKETWEIFRAKYGINETTGLRVGASEDIIAMHKVRPGKPAPIDSAILAIWLKRLILANGPNYIFSVIVPFLHLKQGVMLKVPDGNGGEKLITSVPPAPPANMATTDPERYAALNADRTAYTAALKSNVENIMRYRAEGGLWASSPDIALEVIESGRTISANFIKMMIDLLDEDIARAFGFPLALISANGSELATSRTILELFNTAYAGSRQDYEAVANALIRERFEGQTWEYDIALKDGTQESGTYTLEDAEAEWKLETGDVKDALKEAQTRLADMQALQAAKALGASRADIQAVLDEQGYGSWQLDKFDAAGQPAVPTWMQQGPQEPGMQPIESAIPTDREGLNDEEYRKVCELWGYLGKGRSFSVGKDKDGYFAYTHRARSKSYPKIEEIPQSARDFIETTSAIPADLKPETIPKNEDEKLKEDLLGAYQEAKKSIAKLFEE